MFFGCKDGQVIVVPDIEKANIPSQGLEDGQADSPPAYELFPFALSCGEGSKGIRSLSEWHADWLIIGRNDGHIDVVCWKDYVEKAKEAWLDMVNSPGLAAEGPKLPRFPANAEAIEPGSWPEGARPAAISLSEDPVNFLGWLNRRFFAIACKRGGVWIIDAKAAEKSAPNSSGFRESLEHAWDSFKKDGAAFVEDVDGVNFIARIGQERWALFSNHGQVWIGDFCEKSKTLKCQEIEPWGDPRPGFILDYSYSKPTERDKPFEGLQTFRSERLFLATDIGVYLLIFPENGALKDVEAIPIFLPEITNMCVAMTHFYWLENHYLWVSDAESKGHLFRLPEKVDAPPSQAFYRAVRQPAIQNATDVIQAYACWHVVGKAPVLGQTRRNDRIVLAFFSESQPPNPLRKILGGFDLEHWQENIEAFFEQSKAYQPDTNPRGVDLDRNNPNYQELLLAEFFQKIREDEENREILIEFLQSPAPNLGIQVIGTMLQGKDPGESQASIRLKQALNLWTFTLLAIIHRLPLENQANCYLGLIRWLRGLEALSREDERLMGFSALIKREIRSCLLFVRKWGVFGRSYTTRVQLNIPLTALSAQNDRNQDIDRMVYKSLLQERALDLEDELVTTPAKSNVALDLKLFHIHKRHLGVVSWHEGGLRFFELYEKEPTRLLIKWLEIESDDEAWSAFMNGPSRCVALDVRDGEVWVANTFQVKEEGPPIEGREKTQEVFAVTIFRTSEDKGHGLRLVQADSQKFPGEESVCSLIWLGPQRLLAGLKGKKKKKLLTLDIRQNVDKGIQVEIGVPLFRDFFANGTEKRRYSTSWPGTVPEGKQMPSNPVWVLAQDRDDPNSEYHIVFAGCDDGQVVQLMVPKQKGEISEDVVIGYHVVDRLGAPVQALSCRYIRPFEKKEDGFYRVYAGATDGTIVCLQQVAKAHANGGDTRGETHFATLWATMEEGAISHCQAFQLQPEPKLGETTGPVVAAITNQGRLILFSDIETMAESQASTGKLAHQRHNIPGLRFGRQSLKDRVFAACAFNHKTTKSKLILATGDGQLQVCTIHCPENTRTRRDVSVELFELWNRVREKGGNKAYLHIGEALYSAAQYVSRALVYQMIDYSKTREKELSKADRDWIPRHLRPLFDLDLAWQARQAQEIEENQYLRRALRDAYVLDDQELFKELIRVILKRANKHLFDIAQTIERAEEAEVEKRIYIRIFKDINASRALWQGHPLKAEMRVDIVFAKNMVDGDAMWQVAMRSAKRQAASGSAPADESPIQMAFRTILWQRIDQVRTFLIKGDPLVALETLRACNLSLARASKRLVEQRLARNAASKFDWNPNDTSQEMPWRGFRNFYETISDYAGRVLNRENNTSPALAHEISRTYALGACISPSAVIPIAHRMHEAELPDDLIERTEAQFDVLDFVGLTLPGKARKLFEMALNKDPDEFITLGNVDLLNALEIAALDKPPLEAYRLIRSPDASFFDYMEKHHYAKAKKSVGTYNARAIFAFFPIDYIQNLARILKKQLGSAVENINFSGVPEMAGELDKGKQVWEKRTHDVEGDEHNEYPFEHSLSFWKDTLHLFQKHLYNPKIRSGDFIRPETVLISQKLHRFFDGTVTRLDRLRQEHKIFQPMYSHWRQLFSDLALAAKNFRESAAIQKSIVMGVLSHGLLGSMDELVLELGEMAQALDPFMFFQTATDDMDQDPGRDSMERRFASYLRSRSRFSESIPKNLRSLQGLMEHSDHGGRSDINLCSVLQKLGDGIWDEASQKRTSAYQIKETERKTLELTVGELIQNHKYHGYQHDTKKPGFEVVTSDSSYRDFSFADGINESEFGESEFRKNKNAVAVFFSFYFKREDADRIESIRKELQEPVHPFTNRDRPSHGTGLYLANFAAAVVGWRLEIVKHTVESGEAFGRLYFQLSKHDKG